MIREYYYEKYELIDEWVETEPSEYVDTKMVKTDEVEKEESPHEDYLWFDYRNAPNTVIGRNVYLDYEIAPDGDSGYKLELAGERPRIPQPSNCQLSFNFETGARHHYGFSAYRYFDHPTPVYAITDGIFTEYRTTYFDVSDTRADSQQWCSWGIFEAELDAVYRMTLKEKEMYRIQLKGDYIETIIGEEGEYPEDGIQNGYWWVRQEEYKLEAPELIYPEAISKIEEKVEYFELETKPRITYDPGGYHLRLRVGIRSDFQEQLFSVDTRDSRDNWQYYDGTAWQQFPESGVAANTRVRYNVPENIEWDFGVYFWSAQQYHWFWGYGPLAPFRSIILLTETDQVYKLYINGIPYRIKELNLEESSNGEIGQIDIQLINEL